MSGYKKVANFKKSFTKRARNLCIQFKLTNVKQQIVDTGGGRVTQLIIQFVLNPCFFNLIPAIVCA